MGRGSQLGQYAGAGGGFQSSRSGFSQIPQGSPNELSIARGPLPMNQQGPGLGAGLSQGLGQLQPGMAQQMQPMMQNLFNQLRGVGGAPQQLPPQQPMISDMRYRGPQMQPGMQDLLNQLRGFSGAPQQLPTPQIPSQQPMVTQPGFADPNEPYRPTRPDVFNPNGAPGTKLPDPGFDINNAMNAFGRSLNQRVQSGQMSVADAQRAQAEMRALQLNPTAATRQAATEVAQRNLQVGPYAPQPAAPAIPATPLPLPAAPPPPPPPAAPLPATPPPAAPAIPQGWTVSQAYRDFGGKLANMIKSGQLTPQQANAIKDPAFQATKLGNTPEAFAAMQKAIAGLAGYAAGGYATPVAQEDPRMQAMRYLQRLGR